MGWDLLISVILLITCVQTPFDLAFSAELDAKDEYVKFRYMIDFMFLLDIILNFNTAYLDEIHDIKDNRSDIACKYLKGWFWIDFLAILPFEEIIKLVTDTSGGSGGYNKLVRMSRLSKLYKLIKITRLIRLLKVLKSNS
jgi:hypothetical protein